MSGQVYIVFTATDGNTYTQYKTGAKGMARAAATDYLNGIRSEDRPNQWLLADTGELLRISAIVTVKIVERNY